MAVPGRELPCDPRVKVNPRQDNHGAIPRRQAVKDTNCISLKASETLSSWEAEENFDAILIREEFFLFFFPLHCL